MKVKNQYLLEYLHLSFKCSTAHFWSSHPILEFTPTFGIHAHFWSSRPILEISSLQLYQLGE